MKILFYFIAVFFSLNVKGQNGFANFKDANTFFEKTVLYPQPAIDNNYSGYVLVKFTVVDHGLVVNPVVLFAEDSLLGDAIIAAVKKSNGKWLFKMPYADSTNIILPAYFMIGTPSLIFSKTIRKNPIPPVISNTEEKIIPNLVFMRPFMFTSYGMSLEPMTRDTEDTSKNRWQNKH